MYMFSLFSELLQVSPSSQFLGPSPSWETAVQNSLVSSCVSAYLALSLS